MGDEYKQRVKVWLDFLNNCMRKAFVSTLGEHRIRREQLVRNDTLFLRVARIKEDANLLCVPVVDFSQMVLIGLDPHVGQGNEELDAQEMLRAHQAGMPIEWEDEVKKMICAQARAVDAKIQRAIQEVDGDEAKAAAIIGVIRPEIFPLAFDRNRALPRPLSVELKNKYDEPISIVCMSAPLPPLNEKESLVQAYIDTCVSWMCRNIAFSNQCEINYHCIPLERGEAMHLLMFFCLL
jgi:hypothetical protein